MAISTAQEKRLGAFKISPADLALLRTQKRFADIRLPGLLETLHGVFAAWPEIHRALADPAVH